MGCSPPGFPVHGILQARILGWIAMSSSRGSSQPRDQTFVSFVSCIGRGVVGSSPLTTPGKPRIFVVQLLMSDSLGPHGLQHARFPCPSPSPGACPNSCPMSPTTSSSVIPFSFAASLYHLCHLGSPKFSWFLKDG